MISEVHANLVQHEQQPVQKLQFVSTPFTHCVHGALRDYTAAIVGALGRADPGHLLAGALLAVFRCRFRGTLPLAQNKFIRTLAARYREGGMQMKRRCRELWAKP